MLTCSFGAQAKLVDLSEWRQDGSLSSGNWTVASDKHSVYQSINGNPTAFMSKKTYEFRTFRGDITVNGNDDDYIGFIVSKTASSFCDFNGHDYDFYELYHNVVSDHHRMWSLVTKLLRAYDDIMAKACVKPKPGIIKAHKSIRNDSTSRALVKFNENKK